MEFEKVYGATERVDGLFKVGRSKYEARFGFGKDGDNGYNYRKQYRYKPTVEELRAEIFAVINKAVDDSITSGFRYVGTDGVEHKVWLSTENQFTYKAAADAAMMYGEQVLPQTFKFGTDSDIDLYVFTSKEELAQFQLQAMSYVQRCLNEGWEEKRSIDFTKFVCDE